MTETPLTACHLSNDTMKAAEPSHVQALLYEPTCHCRPSSGTARSPAGTGVGLRLHPWIWTHTGRVTQDMEPGPNPGPASP